jgi:hypothetical protein
MTMDALHAGLRVVEVEVDLHHNATGKDLAGLLQRARQARAIARELTRRRAWRPTPNSAAPAEVTTQTPADQTPADGGSPDREGSPGARDRAGGSPPPPGEPPSPGNPRGGGA